MGGNTVLDDIREASESLGLPLEALLNNKKASAAGAAAFGLGKVNSEGLQVKVMEETTIIGSAAASFDLAANVPAGAVIVSAQANLETLITATTAVKVGVGVAADPDKYGKTTALTKNLKIDTIPDWAVLASAEDVKIFACDAAGAAAGTLDSGTIRTRIVYVTPTSLANA